MPFMYCDPPTKIVSIQLATDASHAGSGHVKLASGATFQITIPIGEGPDSMFAAHLRKTDRIQLCYAPSQRWADAGPRARMAIVGNLANADYTYALAYPGEKKLRR